jgi:bifunctional non-homologous end joining protein LigD
MLAKEADAPFDDHDWIYEIKWDGFRAVAEVENGKVKLYSRNGLSFNSTFPLIIGALEKIRAKAVFDGELVVLNEQGLPEFQLLQQYEIDNSHPIEYRVFDLLSLNGKNLCDLPLIERKKTLQSFLKQDTFIKYSDHVGHDGIAFFNAIKDKNMEGIMAKKADGRYYPGKRTSEWLKIKHHHTEEAIICGFTEPTGSRKYFGALVLGMMKDNQLHYCGHSGSGFDTRKLKELHELMTPLVQSSSPFAEKVKTNTPVTWVKPELICEVKCTEITRDGKLRHPIFLHLRTDKNVNDVTMPTTTDKKAVKTPQKAAGKKNIPTEKSNSKAKEEEMVFGKIKVRTTNRSKIYFPEDGITKGDVIDYYISMADYILPYLKGRPQSLKRNPNGIHDKGFFHKDAGDDAPPWVKSIELFSESAKKNIDYILCDNVATLVYLNNLGCIEINPWHSTIKSLEHPDYLIIDIDPADGNTFDQVIETANVVNSVLSKAGVPSICKTSGSTGLHIYVPCGKKYTYEQVKDFAFLVCSMTNEQLPAFTSMERNLAKRGNNIYLDYLQNRKGQTISSVYSLRPKVGATVSTPLKWKEVKPGLSPLDFNIHSIAARLKKEGDLFGMVLEKGFNLKAALKTFGA